MLLTFNQFFILLQLKNVHSLQKKLLNGDGNTNLIQIEQEFN